MTDPTPPDRPTLTLSKTAKPASDGAASASRGKQRGQAGTNQRPTGDAWAKPQRPANAPRANTLRLDGSAPSSNAPKQPAPSAATPARPFSQARGPAGRNAPQNQTGSYGSFNRQDSAPRGGNSRFDAAAQGNSDDRPARAPAGRNASHNQTRSYGSFNRQDNRPTGAARDKPQRQDGAPRDGNQRLNAPAQGNSNDRQARAPAGRNAPQNQTGAYGSFNRQDSAPRSGNSRFGAPAQGSGDGRQARAPAGRSAAQNQTRSYGSFNRQDNRPTGDAWDKPQRANNTPRGGERRLDAPAPSNREPRRPATPTPRHADASTEGVRLNKYLADKQWCSRREADQWIERGWVTINGKPVEMGQRVQEGDRVHVAAVAHEHQAQQSTIILHKPVGYVSGQAEDGHQPALVLITEQNQWQQGGPKQRKNPRSLMGFAPAGRLDIDSTGILILTQDGRMARHIIGEMSEVEKEYLVRVSYAAPGNQTLSVDVQSQFPAEQLELLRHGLSLDGQALKPAQVDWQNPEQLRFVLREGKKRQIRRMCEQVGLHVTGLKRIRIGQLMLGTLPVGQWRYLGEHESI